MKNLLLFILIVLPFGIAQAQKNSGSGFYYPVTINDAQQKALVRQAVRVQVSLLAGQQGQALWVETHDKTTDAFGQLNIHVGKGTKVQSSIAGSYDALDFSTVRYWIKTEYRIGNGAWIPIAFEAIQSVPYAEGSFEAALPVGSIIPFCGPKEKIPYGWEVLSDRSVSQSEYPKLYALLEKAGGEYLKSGNKELFDMHGRFLRGADARHSDARMQAAGNYLNMAVESKQIWHQIGAFNGELAWRGNTVHYVDSWGNGVGWMARQGENFYNSTIGSVPNYGYNSGGTTPIWEFWYDTSAFFENSKKNSSTVESRPANVAVYYIIKMK